MTLPQQRINLNETEQSHDPTSPGSHAHHHHRTSGQFAGQSVTIRGWLYNMRESGKLLFPIFRDGTGVIQGVVSLKEQPQAFEALKGLHAGIERNRDRKNSAGTSCSGRLRNSHERNRSGPARFGIRLPTQSSSRSTASIFFSISAISGFALRARLPSSASAPKP